MKKRTFGAALREARKGAGLLQRELARALGTTVSHLSQVELGQRHPLPPIDIIKAADVLGVSSVPLLALAVLEPRGESPSELERMVLDYSDRVLEIIRESGGEPLSTSQIAAKAPDVPFDGLREVLRREVLMRGSLYRKRTYLPDSRGHERLQWGYLLDDPEVTRSQPSKPPKTSKSVWVLRVVRTGPMGAHIKYDCKRWYHPGLERYARRKVAVRPVKSDDTLLVEVHPHRPRLKVDRFEIAHL